MSSEYPSDEDESITERPASTGDDRSDEDGTGELSGERDRATLATELETLRAENERLRTSYARARRSQYRQTAIGFAVLGLLTTAGGVLFPAMRTVLLALGGTGLFAALLTWFITPERFVSASVGDAVYEALARNHDRLCRELGLTDERLYVPLDDATTGVRLFVPQQTAFEIPDDADLESLFVVGDDESTRGVSLRPTGESLFGEFEATLTGPLGEGPGEIVTQVSEAVVEQFEIAKGVETELDAENGRLSLQTTGNIYDNLARFDHPVVSIAAVALAHGLDRPVRVELVIKDVDATATLRWEPVDTTTSENGESGSVTDTEGDEPMHVTETADGKREQTDER